MIFLRKIFCAILIIFGITLCSFSFYPLINLNRQVDNSIQQWEKFKNDTHPSIENIEKNEQEIENFKGLIGILKISNFEKRIPIHIGIDNNTLNKGLGLDKLTHTPGEIGNSVIYGHRENILWNLKYVNIGDELLIETIDNELKYKIFDLQVVSPDDPYIEAESEESIITLVTCYPFIYMGPTPERFVVKARLMD